MQREAALSASADEALPPLQSESEAESWCMEASDCESPFESDDVHSDCLSGAEDSEEDTPPRDAVDHLNRALFQEFDFCKQTALDKDVVDIITALCRDPKGLERERDEAFVFWRRRAQELEAERRKFVARLPKRLRATVGKLHIPLLREMLLACGHEDIALIEDILKGFPVTGPMCAGGVGVQEAGGVRTHRKPAHDVVPDIQELKASCRERNQQTLQQARVDQHAGEIWEKSKEERKKGMLGHFIPLEDLDLDEVLLVHRFAVEQTNARGRKIRCIDNFKANGVNSYAVAFESTRNDREDVISQCVLEMQRELHAAGRDGQVLAGVEDFVGAFKTVAPSEDQRFLMWCLLWDPQNERWVAAEMYTMPFGAMGGVLSWYRCAMAQRCLLRRLFKLCIFYYVDDTHQFEITETAVKGKRLMQQVMGLLGWDLDPEKSQGMSSSVTSLGCHLHITRSGVTWQLSNEKAESWSKGLAEAVRDQHLSPEEAGRWVGRLNFGGQKVFGAVGRAALRPLICRQYSKHATGTTGRLENALRWWLAFLKTCPKKKLFWQDANTDFADVFVYTDAEKNGKIGVVLVEPERGYKLFARARVPAALRGTLRRRKTQINLFELSGVLLALNAFSDIFENKRVVFYIDNMAALNMMVKGYSRQEDANAMVFTAWLRAAEARCTVRWLYVPSRLNIADGPSRDRLKEVEEIEAAEVEVKWPAKVGLHDIP